MKALATLLSLFLLLYAAIMFLDARHSTAGWFLLLAGCMVTGWVTRRVK